MFILLLLIDRASAGTVKLHVHVWSRSTFDVGRLGNRWIWETPIWTSPVISTPAAKGGEATAVVVQVGEGHSRIRRRRLLVPKHLKDGASGRVTDRHTIHFDSRRTIKTRTGPASATRMRPRFVRCTRCQAW